MTIPDVTFNTKKTVIQNYSIKDTQEIRKQILEKRLKEKLAVLSDGWYKSSLEDHVFYLIVNHVEIYRCFFDRHTDLNEMKSKLPFCKYQNKIEVSNDYDKARPFLVNIQIMNDMYRTSIIGFELIFVSPVNWEWTPESDLLEILE